jgi:hypothetical protein
MITASCGMGPAPVSRLRSCGLDMARDGSKKPFFHLGQYIG